jgi:cell division protein FtsQ
MMPKARPAPRRRFGWLFGRRGNRRVRLVGGPLPVASLARDVAGSVRRRGRAWLVVLLVAAATGAAVGGHAWVTRSPYFAVRTIKISPTRHVSAASLEARAGQALGANLFRVDLDEVARDVSAEPWVLSAHARRELPSTLSIEVVERDAACVVALGGTLYLGDAHGAVFKRATPAEAAALPAVTGIERDRYLADADGARGEVLRALVLYDAWRAPAAGVARVPARPAVGEIHVDRAGTTLYLAAGGVGVRIGRVDETLPARLARFDAVWAALAASGERPRLIHLENRARPDRVTVKLAASGGAPPT